MSTYDYMPQGKKHPKRSGNMRRKQKRRGRRILLLAGVLTIWGLRCIHYDNQQPETQIEAEQYTVRYKEQETDTISAAAGEPDTIEAAAGEAASEEETLPEDRLLLLVNKDHALPDDYEVQLCWLQNKSSAVSVEMYDALKEMLTDGSTDGREFVVASGYRDTEYQQKLLEEDIEADMANEGLTYQQAYEKETKETMPPGYSEHETGLAVDIVALDYQVLDEQQENTSENKWLRENCSKYGFILRYPSGKEDITGIDYEPWHFRYVGKEAAGEITSRGITLEEYLETDTNLCF